MIGPVTRKLSHAAICKHQLKERPSSFGLIDPAPWKRSGKKNRIKIQEVKMPKKKYRPEEIISKLREVDVMQAEGMTVAEVVKALGIP